MRKAMASLILAGTMLSGTATADAAVLIVKPGPKPRKVIVKPYCKPKPRPLIVRPKPRPRPLIDIDIDF